MSKALGDPKKLKFVVHRLTLKVETGPFAEVGRAAAEIDGDIPDMTGEDPDQFALRLAELVVQATEHAFYGKGLIILNESRRKTGA